MLFIILSSLDDPDLEAKFSDFYEKYKKLAFKIAYNYFDDFGIVEEVVQTAFFALSRNFSKIHEIDDDLKKIYLVKSVRSACIDVIRKSNRNPQLIEQFEYVEICSNLDIQAELESNEKLERIYIAVGEMPPRRRDAISCRLFANLSYSAIAKILHISTGVVKKEIHTGMKKLKKIIREMENE